MDRADKNIRLEGACIAIVLMFLYLGHLSSRYSFDGTMFAYFIAKAVYNGNLGSLIHPHHLSYLPTSYLFIKLISALGIKASVIALMQVMDTFFACGTLALFYVFSFSIVRNRFISAIFTLLLGFSFGFWYFAIEPEVYSSQAFYLLLGMYILWRLTSPETHLSWQVRAAIFGVVGLAVMSSHLMCGLFMAPLGWGAMFYFRQPAKESILARIRSGLLPFIVFTVIAFSTFAAVIYIGYRLHPLSSSWRISKWIIGLASPDLGIGSGKGYWAFSLSSIPQALTGFSESVVASGQFRYVTMPALDLPGIIALVGFVSGLISYALLLPGLMRRDKRTHILLLMSIVPLLLFTVIWEPSSIELKTAQLPGLWLLSAIAYSEALGKLKSSRYRVAFKAIAVAVAGSLLACNYLASIRPGTNPELNADLQRAYFIRDHTEPNAVVYLSGLDKGYLIGKIYIIYFAGRQTRVADWIMEEKGKPPLDSLKSAIYFDRSRPTYVLSELLMPGPVLEQLAANHHVKSQEILGVLEGRNPQLVASMSDGFALYKLH